MSEIVFLYVTVPHESEARTLARTLIEERLAACANLVPGMKSLYRWEGKIEEESETVLLVKTRRSLAAAVTARIVELHSYDVPCVVEWPIAGGSAPYLEWIQRETLGEKS